VAGEVLGVRLRNGRVVPFDRKHIERAVRRAQDVAGEDDPPFAEEVADVVALTLSARYSQSSRSIPQREGIPHTASPPRAPAVSDVEDLLEQALIEMGRAPVAKAYILHRDRRERAREALTITTRPDRGGPMPWVRDGAGTSPWNPARIVAALMQEADLPREIAEELAERVEARVFDSGLRRLSTSLIREFVDNELMAMGLETALHRQEPVGIPRHDLRELLTRPRPRDAVSGFGAGSRRADADRWGADPPALDGALAEALLSRYSLADVFDERTADLHKNGAIHIQGAERPHQRLSCSVPAELLLAGEPTAHSGFELIGELARLLGDVSQGLVLEGLYSVVAPLCRTSRASAGLRELLAALGAVGCAAGKRLDLAAPGGRGASLAGRLVRELSVLSRESVATPRLFLAWDELAPALEGQEELAEAAEHLLRAGVLVPVWHGRTERWAAPGCRRRKVERGALACAGAVALNLPRLARQAGPWREDLMLEALATRVQNALDALESLATFQATHAAAQTTGLRQRTSFALTPVGLTQALRILGDGEVRPGVGARILGVLSEATRRFAEARGLCVVASPFFGDQARERFARIDARAPRASQPRLFPELPAPEAERELVYSSGYDLPDRPRIPHASAGHAGAGHASAGQASAGQASAERGSALATLCGTLPCGALFPFHIPDALCDESRPALGVWQRFHAQRFGPERLETGRRDSLPSADTRDSDVGLFRSGLR